MADQQTLDYLKTQLAAGYTYEQLKSTMVAHGYQATDIDAAYQELQGGSAPAPQTPPSPGQASAPAQNTQAAPGATKLKKRNPFVVLLLIIITFGIYSLVWMYKTADEIQGAAPSAPKPGSLFLLFIPFIGAVFMIVYYIKLALGCAEVTGKSKGLYVVLMLLLAFIAFPIIQNDLNAIAA